MAGLIVLAIVVIFVLIVAARTIRIVPQARAGVVERLGRYQRTLAPGLAIVVPFIDKVKPLIDLREQVITFAPQPVITEDNLVVQIDTVLYFTITDPKSAAYEVANPLQAIEALTVTTLRNVIGGMSLEDTLTSRDNINSQLRVVLDEPPAAGASASTASSSNRSTRRPRSGGDGEADARRARQARRHPHRRGLQAVAILTAQGERSRPSSRPRASGVGDPAVRG